MAEAVTGWIPVFLIVWLYWKVFGMSLIWKTFKAAILLDF